MSSFLDDTSRTAENYKTGITNEEEFAEISKMTEKITTDISSVFPKKGHFFSQTPQEDIDDLNNYLLAHSDGFSVSSISKLQNYVCCIPPKFLTEDQVNKIFNGLPELSFDYFPNAFQMFQHITSNPKLAKIVLEHHYIQEINFDCYDSLELNDLAPISYTIFYLINADPNQTDNPTLEIFYQTFFPHFYAFLIGKDNYKCSDLSPHLNVAQAFLTICNEIEFNNLFHTFTFFTQRQSSRDMSASLYGVCKCLSIRSDLVSEFNGDDTFLDRLLYAAQRKTSVEDQDAVQVRNSALVVYEYIASQSSIRCDFKAYLAIRELLLKNFYSNEDGIQDQAIYLFGLAIANKIFTTSIEYDDLVKMFLSLYDNLTATVKKEWIQSFANLIYFLEPDYIINLIQTEENFVACLEDALSMNIVEVQLRLVASIKKLIFSNPEVVDIFLSIEEFNIYDALSDLVDSDNQDLIILVEDVLSIFQSHMKPKE